MDDEVTVTKRRMTRACDRCRVRKIKCYDIAEQGNGCLNCIVLGAECTYMAPSKRRGPKSVQESAVSSNLPRRKYNASYVADLERRAEQLERTLKERNPDIIIPEGTKRHVLVSSQGSSRPASLMSELAELDDDFTSLDLGEKMKNLSLEHDTALSERCFGPSSALALFMSALSAKKKLTGSLNTMQLQDYSNLYHWERATAETEIIKPGYVFPDSDLITSLIAIYSETIHPILPIMHRPTFMKDVADGLHLRDESFGATLLFVLAVASRYSDDPRVLADPSSRLSAGWKFIEPIPVSKKAILRPPCLYNIQETVLAVIYTLGTSVPEFSWMVVGLGLRYAVEIGLHRKKPRAKGHKLTVDDELKKRSFWALVTLDRLISLYDGRPLMMHEEDFDSELPVECDDEYWDIRSDGEVRFCQPGNKPSKISYFNAQIRLSGIMSVVATNLYSIKKRRDRWGLTGKDEQRINSDIDSSMNAWMNSIPDHLRWNPDRDNTLFLYQSAVLYNTYHMLQIYTHRPFLCPGSSLSTPSLVLSTIAARSCSRILQVHMKRIKIIIPHILMGAFMSGAVLAMNIWSGKRVGHPPKAEDLTGYEQCLATFIHASDSWMVAGRALKMFKCMASFDTASVLDGTSIQASHPQENATPVPAPIGDSYFTVSDALYEQDPAYLNDYLPTYLHTGPPLDPTENLPSSSQTLFDVAQSEMWSRHHQHVEFCTSRI
ncbi:fungal-specific transcription factor domain-containing protein [Desarmillaria tabescens]|uniref:Fungal-specific transcription factor domain-containing protein n=1 Tax=Armillaria tabescens TaxID=1929756 RepID=A0AA39JYB7_ARMTA|nr:fungal-specific transcription factor domain-containing protein [Desarmillaria tabescens]KAK0451180.1 fungal-specific transcription factor domain-containing protein [Desarmillaria tabescens]